ncbi:MAG: MBL fold metallo-hydrolase [Deltaproteobacteria bacterium]|nr:MBL fold metallo-hydrolase [Deltaproteobacteria bacterium]MBI3386196.1 MBL fold metallo-hydrolase [Deltaproteobacteria bacterium]
MPTITEIASDIFRISTFVPEFNLQFNQFLVRDDEPLLFHTGMKGMFPVVREGVASLIDPARLRWIGFSHFESDECGALNEWLALAPQAQAMCTLVGALVSVNDFAIRPAHAMEHHETFTTGRKRFRFLKTPHVPHCWEASLLFEETTGTLLCSDLFTHGGDVEAVTTADVVERARRGLEQDEAGPLANAYPFTPHTERILNEIADLKPRTLALMHGSSFVGDGERALRDLAATLREVLGLVA